MRKISPVHAMVIAGATSMFVANGFFFTWIITRDDRWIGYAMFGLLASFALPVGTLWIPAWIAHLVKWAKGLRNPAS